MKWPVHSRQESSHRFRAPAKQAKARGKKNNRLIIRMVSLGGNRAYWWEHLRFRQI